MNRRTTAVLAATAFVLILGAASAFAQASFKVTFPLKVSGKTLAAGEYAVAPAADGSLVLTQVSTGKQTPLAVMERIAQPVPPVAEPKLVFDEVGDFAPSYTEYITVYVLSEVWLPGEDGYRIHVTKGAHKTKEVKGELKK